MTRYRDYKVTAKAFEYDDKPEVLVFDCVYEANDYVADAIQDRVQWRVDHSPYSVTEAELLEWQYEETALFTLEEMEANNAR